MTLAELRALQATHHARMKEILALAKTEKRNLTSEEGTEFDELKGKIATIRGDIERMEESERIERELNEPQRKPLFTPQSQNPDNQEERDEADKDIHQRAFWKMASAKPMTDAETRALVTTADAKGGYLVPESFADKIIMKVSETSVMRQVATVSSSTSVENLPVEGDDGDNAWIDEEGTYPESDPTIGQVQLAAHKTGRIVKVSDEALQDTIPQIEDYVVMKFSKSTTKIEEAAFVNGNGVKKPTGFLTNCETGVTTALATGFTSDEIIDLEYSLDDEYDNNAMWMMNKNTVAMVRKLKDADGNYIWQKGLSGEPDTLDGYPILRNKHMPDVATGVSPIAFGDFSYYNIKDRKVMTLKKMLEKYADTGHVGFRIDKRVDGKLVLPAAIKKMVMA